MMHPNTAAKREVKKYHAQTPSPIFPKVLSGRLAAPQMMVQKMIGITIILSMFTRMLPKGARMLVAMFRKFSP